MGFKLNSETGELTTGLKPGDSGFIISEPDPFRRLVMSIDAFSGAAVHSAIHLRDRDQRLG